MKATPRFIARSKGVSAAVAVGAAAIVAVAPVGAPQAAPSNVDIQFMVLVPNRCPPWLPVTFTGNGSAMQSGQSEANEVGVFNNKGTSVQRLGWNRSSRDVPLPSPKPWKGSRGNEVQCVGRLEK